MFTGGGKMEREFVEPQQYMLHLTVVVKKELRHKATLLI